jgi:ATP-binding cassette, subfamily B, bacterial
MPDFQALSWPASRLGEALSALANHAGFESARELGAPESGSALESWIEWGAKRLGCEAHLLEIPFRDLEDELSAAYPALLSLQDSFLLVVSGSRRKLRVLTPARDVERISVCDVASAIREPLERGPRAQFEHVLNEVGIPSSKQARTLRLLMDDQSGSRPFRGCWILRPPPGASTFRSLREANSIQHGAALIATHLAQYLVWLASWAILGSLSFTGHLDRGWLAAWALLLVTFVPFQILTTRLQGSFAVGLGGWLKRRLLSGALRLKPEEMRHSGIGGFLGQALEAASLESLAISGGIAGILAAIELILATFLLGRFAPVLLVWCALAVLIAYRFTRHFERWTTTRMEITQDLVESMVGHRTRLVQQCRADWHTAEDAALDRYLQISRRLDNFGVWLVAAIPRGWLLVGLACLAPSVFAPRSSSSQMAILLGGILLAYTAFRKLSSSFADIAIAAVAWKRIRPLLKAAEQPEILGESPAAAQPAPEQKLIEADRITFRYRSTGNAALRACSLSIQMGDRILLEGPSGGGKTTFASLLSGMRQPESGLLLMNGVDQHTLGEVEWRHRIAAAPQFHENYILTETLAFNLLMGRRWPAAGADMEEAETVCRELGLGDLLDRMPSRLLQMVGEGGWQLSHGERSRIYIARALLQDANLVILDESFAALDPENLQTSLECVLRRAGTLMVIAHP